jgi:dGTP triphosphohydrolase
LTSDQLIKSNNDRVNDLLLHVDDLMEETSEVLEHFIVDYVLTDKDEPEFVGARRSTIEELQNIYDQVADKMREVRSEIF